MMERRAFYSWLDSRVVQLTIGNQISLHCWQEAVERIICADREFLRTMLM